MQIAKVTFARRLLVLCWTILSAVAGYSETKSPKLEVKSKDLIESTSSDQSAPTVLVKCESLDFTEKTCPANVPIASVTVYQQLIDVKGRLASSACVSGVSWKHDSNSITVSKGCRAVFEVKVAKQIKIK